MTPKLFGLLLITAGILLLLQNMEWLQPIQGLIWMALFLTGGVIFLALFMRSAANWWAAIPGFSLLSLAAVIALDVFLPQLQARWGGPLFLGTLSLGFWAIYFVQRTQWWAIIPGGVLLTLATVVGVNVIWPGVEPGAVLFIGLALTFSLLALVPTPNGRMRWAWIPAGVAAAIGLAVMAAATAVLDITWPAALIAAGVYLLYRTRRSRQAMPDTDQEAPEQADAAKEQYTGHSPAPR